MKKLFASLAVVLLLGGCTALGLSTTTVSTTKAQQMVDLSLSVQRTVLRGETIYLKQPPCGLPASPAPPLCASLAVGQKVKALDARLKSSTANVQAAITSAGANPTIDKAIVDALELAMTELKSYASNNGVTP